MIIQVPRTSYDSYTSFHITIWIPSSPQSSCGMSLPERQARYGIGFDWIRYHISCFVFNRRHFSDTKSAVASMRIYKGADLTSTPKSLKHIVEGNK